MRNSLERKIVWLYIQATEKETLAFIKQLDSLNLPYKIIVMNRPLFLLSKQDIKTTIKLLESVLLKVEESKSESERKK